MASALRDDAYETTTLPLPHAVPAAAPARRFPWPVLVAAIALVVLLGAVWAANQGTSVHPDTPAALTPSASPAAHATHQARHRRRHVHRTSGPKASPVSGPVRHAAPRHHHPAAHGGGHSETKKGGPHKPGKPGHAKRGHKGGKG